ncbi:MAG: hypothetical protein H7281_08535 [Bacteriovorax sp.]|nr:hypothetical protein [Bacteriovorax sp.]
MAEIIFTIKLNPHENSVFIFLIVWGTLPLVTLLLFLIKTPRLLYSMSRTLVQTSAVVGFGMIYKINSIYIHPDPRGAIALTTIPIIQTIGALFIGLVIKIASQKYYRSMTSQEELEDEDEDEYLS